MIGQGHHSCRLARFNANMAIRRRADLVGIGAGDTAIDLDPGVHVELIAHRTQLADLLQLRRDELLAAEARVHCAMRNNLGSMFEVP